MLNMMYNISVQKINSEGKSMNIDTVRLKRDLCDYFGTMIDNGFPLAAMELCEVESASDEQLIKRAKTMGFGLDGYKTDGGETA